MVAELKQNPLLLAVDGLSIALVPYANLTRVEPGTPVHACRFGFVGCRRVGTVGALLAGELSFQHPHRDTQVRGRLVQLDLDEPAAAEQTVLFVGDAPLGL